MEKRYSHEDGAKPVVLPRREREGTKTKWGRELCKATMCDVFLWGIVGTKL